MSEELNTPQAEQQTVPQTQAPQTTAVNVDYSSIIETAAQKAAQETEKKFDGVLKSMIKQQAPDVDNAILQQLVADYKLKQPTPEKMLAEKDTKIATLQATIESEQQKNTAILKGVPLSDETQADKVNACLTLAKSYVNETVTYDQALDKALLIISFAKEQTPVPKFGASGSNGVTATADGKSITELMQEANTHPERIETIMQQISILNKK